MWIGFSARARQRPRYASEKTEFCENHAYCYFSTLHTGDKQYDGPRFPRAIDEAIAALVKVGVAFRPYANGMPLLKISREAGLQESNDKSHKTAVKAHRAGERVVKLGSDAPSSKPGGTYKAGVAVSLAKEWAGEGKVDGPYAKEREELVAKKRKREEREAAAAPAACADCTRLVAHCGGRVSYEHGHSDGKECTAAAGSICNTAWREVQRQLKENGMDESHIPQQALRLKQLLGR